MSRDILDTKYDRFFQAGFIVGALCMTFLLAAIWPTSAQAGVFPPWPKVTPQTMLEVIPEYTWAGQVGSVRPKESHQKADGCPITESGRVVGWSLNCFPSADRGGIRGRP